ncbi:MAG: LysR family transcriptional regulator [Paracoccaceae bacterium]
MILDGIDVFTEVVDAQSFSRAARRLGMPVSTVSARVARLEDRLGATLIRRTTRQLSVTPLGQRYYDRCVRALAEMAAAERELADASEDPSGPLHISAAADLAQFKLVPVIDAYLARHPRTTVDLSVTNRHVDLIAEDVDLAVRIGTLPDSSLVARRYFEARMGLWATPAYLDRHGTPQSPADLAGHGLVRLSRDTGALRLLDGEGQPVPLDMPARIAADDMQSCRSFALAGAGIAILPDFIGNAPDAPLVRVLPRIASAPIAPAFVYPAQRFVPRTVRAFIDLAMAMERGAGGA